MLQQILLTEEISQEVAMVVTILVQHINLAMVLLQQIRKLLEAGDVVVATPTPLPTIGLSVKSAINLVMLLALATTNLTTPIPLKQIQTCKLSSPLLKDPLISIGIKILEPLTNDLANLNMQVEDYPSSDQIRVRNGIGLSMKHIGSTKLSTPSSSFILNDVLHVLEITKNLIFVQKFTNDTNTSIEFHPSYFLVKAQVSGIILLCGPSRHGLYFPSSSNNRSPSSTTFIGERTSKAQWHHRL